MEGGIENVYHDPCQDWLDLIGMTLTSPNFPGRYNPLDNCTWIIKAPPEHFVSLNFEIIDVSHMFERHAKIYYIMLFFYVWDERVRSCRVRIFELGVKIGSEFGI